MQEIKTVQSTLFYATYRGHPILDLKTLHRHFRSTGKRIVWLIGDSSMDNKHWLIQGDKMFNDFSNPLFCAPAVNGYEDVLVPPRSVKDVCYWINTLLLGTEYVCLNAAVEEACLQDAPNEHDRFVLEHLEPTDVVICSIGGNDIALKPSAATLVALGIGTYLVPQCMLSSAFRWVPFNPLYDIFYNQTLEHLNRFSKAAKRLVCTLYYPCETGTGWANRILQMFDMGKLQEAIRLCHAMYHCRIGPSIPLYEALDPKDPEDYVCRVEPSVKGGYKIALKIVEGLE